MPSVQPESTAELLAAARRMAFRPDDTVVARIDAALALATDPGDIGKLLVAKTVAIQGRGDPATPGETAQRAIPHLVAAGDLATASFATAMAAVFLDQAGDIAAGVDHAVDALVLLSDVELDEIEAVRASLALSGFMFRRCAFDLAIDMGVRAFDGARLVEGLPIDVVAFTTGYVAAEGGHVATDDATRDRRLLHARDAASWLRAHGSDEISRSMLGPALDAEVDLALGRPVDVEPLDAAASLYDDAAPDLIAWHLMVRGIAAACNGSMVTAVELLDAALPGLVASADDHCRVRALRTRAHAKAEMGDLAGAYADASELATITRRWQLEQVGGLADQVARRADLERSSSVLRSTAEQLADDMDRDPMTGVHSRRWLDRHLSEMEQRTVAGSALMFDLDRFKGVNDTYGHHVGDEVLALVGDLLRSNAGDLFEVSRFGGEEFAVVTCQPDPTVVADYAERIRSAVETFPWADVAPGLRLTISGGVAHGRLDEIRQLLVVADEALLAAKRSGRNRITTATWREPVPSTG